MTPRLLTLEDIEDEFGTIDIDDVEVDVTASQTPRDRILHIHAAADEALRQADHIVSCSLPAHGHENMARSLPCFEFPMGRETTQHMNPDQMNSFHSGEAALKASSCEMWAASSHERQSVGASAMDVDVGGAPRRFGARSTRR